MKFGARATGVLLAAISLAVWLVRQWWRDKKHAEKVAALGVSAERLRVAGIDEIAPAHEKFVAAQEAERVAVKAKTESAAKVAAARERLVHPAGDIVRDDPKTKTRGI